MPPGRAPDACWKYFKPNTGADKDKKPYVDIFHGKTHADNAPRAKLFLAFDCPEFMNTRSLEWQQLVADLTEKNVQQRKDADKQTWRRCKQAELERTTTRAPGAGGSGATEGGDSHLPRLAAQAGAYGGSILCAGLSAATLELKETGRQFLSKHVDSISSEELRAVNALLFRWLTRKGLPLNACDGELFDEIIAALRPSAKGKTLTYDKIRCVFGLPQR
jgi:hypothetical protein